jgi:hypothetical protein
VQVIVLQRVLETHFALFSPRAIIQLDHLQTGVTLRPTGIDALFLAIADRNQEQVDDSEVSPDRVVSATPEYHELLVICEARGLRDDVIMEQVLNQVRASSSFRAWLRSSSSRSPQRPSDPSRLVLYEFESVREDNASTLEALTLARSVIYQFKPLIPGIGAKPKKSAVGTKKKKKAKKKQKKQDES